MPWFQVYLLSPRHPISPTFYQHEIEAKDERDFFFLSEEDQIQGCRAKGSLVPFSKFVFKLRDCFYLPYLAPPPSPPHPPAHLSLLPDLMFLISAAIFTLSQVQRGKWSIGGWGGWRRQGGEGEAGVAGGGGGSLAVQTTGCVRMGDEDQVLDRWFLRGKRDPQKK